MAGRDQTEHRPLLGQFGRRYCADLVSVLAQITWVLHPEGDRQRDERDDS